jgi:hypothetical protein
VNEVYVERLNEITPVKFGFCKNTQINYKYPYLVINIKNNKKKQQDTVTGINILYKNYYM